MLETNKLGNPTGIIPDSFFFFKGRVALYAILKTIGIQLGDEVILPGFTCVVVPNAITYLGARPIYVDINPETYNIDPQKIEEKITGKTKAIIVQHTFGIPAEMDKIMDIAKKYNLYVIEDSCHAIGSKYKDKEVGTFGDAAFFSSQWSKPLTTGLGGWAIVNNLELKEGLDKIYPQFMSPSLKEVLLLRLQYFIYSKLFKPSLFWFTQNTYRKLSRLGITIGSSSNKELECEMPDGYGKKMSQWQRDLLEKKFMEINRAINHRRWVTSLYEEQLAQKGMKTVVLPKEYEPVFLRYPLLVKNKIEVLSEAQKRRIEIGDWFVSPVHPNLIGWEKVGYQKGMCPIAERICEYIINLPTSQEVGAGEIDRIVDFIGHL
jgi:perosamine synthetase